MSLSYATLPGDIDHLIADDHAMVERTFQHLEAGRGDRRTLVDQVTFNLALHAFAEEQVLYPAWAEAGMDEEDQEARDEHAAMKEQIVVLDGAEPGETEFEQALTDLIHEVRHHVGEEEGEELPAFRARVGAARMAELGEAFLAAKRRAPTRAHPHAPDTQKAEAVAAAAAAPLDKLRDAVSKKDRGLTTDASGLLNEQAQAIVDAYASLRPRPLEILEPAQARKQPGPDDAVRKVMEQRGIDGPEPVGSVDERTIPGPGGDLSIRIYTPENAATAPLPVLLWIHGGGFVLFDVDTYDASCRGLANKAGCMVVSPAYRQAPEHVFPASHDDVLATYLWVTAHADELGGDPARVAIGGEEVGGTMAAATCLQLEQAGRPLPVAQALVCPLASGEQAGDSMEDAADARPLHRPLLSWMAMHAFHAVPDAASDPRIDLLGLSSELLAGLPPAVVITAERDVLRDQGEAFARNLQAAGVPVETVRYEGVMQEFFGAATVLDEAEAAQHLVARHLREAFSAT